MLIASNFSKKRLRLRSFDSNLQKNCGINILENGTGQILLIVALMFGIWSDY